MEDHIFDITENRAATIGSGTRLLTGISSGEAIELSCEGCLGTGSDLECRESGHTLVSIGTAKCFESKGVSDCCKWSRSF